MLISSLGQRQKNRCFLKDQVEVWKVEDDEKLEELEQFCSGVYVQRYSIFFLRFHKHHCVLTPKGKVYRSIIKRMSKISKLPLLFGVANVISCVAKFSMVFHEEQVQTNVANELRISQNKYKKLYHLCMKRVIR